MTEKEADLFDSYEQEIEAMYEEIGLLSKKKPDGAVNKFKLKFINEILDKVNERLGADYLPLAKFTGFDESDMPTNSDVVFILSQYMKSMDRFRHHNTELSMGRYYWILDDGKDLWKATRRSTFLR